MENEADLCPFRMEKAVASEKFCDITEYVCCRIVESAKIKHFKAYLSNNDEKKGSILFDFWGKCS